MSAPQRNYDAIIVGARVAGAATALALARRGLDVLAVERGHRGSDTLSTLALMRSGVMQLDHWGLLDAVRDAGTPPVRRTVFHYGEESLAFDVEPAFGVDALYAPRRTVLDPLLAAAAERAGAELRFRASVDELVADRTGRIVGIAGRDAGGERFEARGALVIGADGFNSVVARTVGARPTRSTPRASFVIYGFLEVADADGYEWAFDDAMGAGIIPTNDGASCVFVAASSERFDEEKRPDLETAFHRLLRRVHPQMAERVASSPAVERLRGFPGIDGYLRRSSGPGWALVGDAGYFKDPISAHGLSDALRDAELLARAAAEAIEHPEIEREALDAYESTRDELSLPLFDITDRIASFDWSREEIQGLHRELVRSMKAEAKHLAALHESGARRDASGDAPVPLEPV